MIVDPKTGVDAGVPVLVGALHEWMHDAAILRRLRLSRTMIEHMRVSTEGAIKDQCRNVDEYWLRRHVLLFLNRRWVRDRIAMQHSVRHGLPAREVMAELEAWREECRAFCAIH